LIKDLEENVVGELVYRYEREIFRDGFIRTEK